MENNIVKIKLEEVHIKSFLSFLIRNKIYYSNLSIDNDIIYLKVDVSTYKNIKYSYKKNVKIIKYYGIKGIFNFINSNKYLLSAFIWGCFMLFLLNNSIFSVEIRTNDKELHNIVEESLIESGIGKYKFKKSYAELSLIKKEILLKTKDKLEWIEIKEKGTKYIVELTPRIIRQETEEKNDPRHIIAKKDGLIMYLTSSSGQKIKDINDYVKKGDVIISGNIIKGEDKIVDQVYAEGQVFAEVWYTVNTTIPYEYIEYSATDEVVNHYYLDFFGKKMTLLGRYESEKALSEKEIIVDKPYLFFKLVKEKKTIYDYKTIKLTKEQALEEALKRSDNKIKTKLRDDERIIDKKVLKITHFSSKINVEVFYKVYEDIKDVSYIAKISEESDKK